MKTILHYISIITVCLHIFSEETIPQDLVIAAIIMIVLVTEHLVNIVFKKKE